VKPSVLTGYVRSFEDKMKAVKHPEYRLMEAFSKKLFECLGPNNPFATSDAAFILSFSTIMLNTDLHNRQIQAQKKMTK
jgi:hypothetical protein